MIEKFRKIKAMVKGRFALSRRARYSGNETGRSMVEMLGVLAIMGVLTIGSLWLYRYSLDVIMANSIVTGVKARSIIVGQQRVLQQELNLKEFHPDTEEDLIYNRFEVIPFNDYKNECQGEGCSKVITNCNIGDNVQVMEVYDIPYRVCENLKKLQFVDPTCNAVNGDVYMRMDGYKSPEIKCIPDGEVPATTEGQDKSALLNTEYQNIATFVFDNGVGEGCETDNDCFVTGCCDKELHVCVPPDGRECTPPKCEICEKFDEEDGICAPNEDKEGKRCANEYDSTTGKSRYLCCDHRGHCNQPCDPDPSSSSSSSTVSSSTTSSVPPTTTSSVPPTTTSSVPPTTTSSVPPTTTSSVPPTTTSSVPPTTTS
ncbi:MAG: hypothetical protein SPL08_04675, partial [Pseudomonadota bacterium]|nr:hypothetical protein [Pseudomonadota bacterium]